MVHPLKSRARWTGALARIAGKPRRRPPRRERFLSPTHSGLFSTCYS
jgi:hypothetical protein